MKSTKDNVIVKKSFDFAVRIVRLYQYMTANFKIYELSKQLLKSGTSIGANVNEGVAAISKKEFRAKLSISLKEARECEYWLDLLFATDYLTEEQHKSLKNDVVEIIKILTAIIKSSDENKK